MELVPATTLPLERLAALFTAGYEGYSVPVEVDAATLRTFVEAWDLDLERSRVALEADSPVGVALLGRRRDRSWIGGLGVVPEARRHGVGRALLEAILEQAPARVQLEVIEGNKGAIRLYEQLGFVRRRFLEVWSLAAKAPPAAAREVDARPLGQPDLPWQRQDASLPADYERLEVDGGAVLIRVADNQVSVLQLAAGSNDAAAELLAAARARGDALRYVNVPEGDPASAALSRLGGRLELRQIEMSRGSRA